MLGKVLVGDPASAENAALEFVDPNAANMVRPRTADARGCWPGGP